MTGPEMSTDSQPFSTGVKGQTGIVMHCYDIDLTLVETVISGIGQRFAQHTGITYRTPINANKIFVYIFCQSIQNQMTLKSKLKFRLK